MAKHFFHECNIGCQVVFPHIRSVSSQLISHSIASYRIASHRIVLIPHRIALHHIALHFSAPHCTALRCFALHNCNVQHNTARQPVTQGVPKLQKWTERNWFPNDIWDGNCLRWPNNKRRLPTTHRQSAANRQTWSLDLPVPSNRKRKQRVRYGRPQPDADLI